VHFWLAGDAEKEPAGQREHEADLAADIDPEGQVWQVALPLVENLPAGHGKQRLVGVG
jgi:hypothetical protein